MINQKNVIFIVMFFLVSLLYPPILSADSGNSTARSSIIKEGEAFAYEYINDLRTQIEKEKYSTLPKLSEKFHLRQSGSVRNETAGRTVKPRELTKIKNQLLLSETGRLNDNLRFKASFRAYYDAVYSLTDNFSKSVASDQEFEMELRDTYIDYSNGPWDMRLGKQQIVWGEAVALFFADVVNAKDLREFVLPSFDLIRTPQWGADLEYSKEKFHAEFVWLPILEFDKLGVSGSEFAPLLPLPSALTPYTTKDPGDPKNSLDNSEMGLRLSYLLNGWDFSAFYLHTWTRSPIYFRAINSGIFDFSPSYKRLNILGATFAKELNGIVFKGEFVLNRKDYFSIIDANNPDGVLRRNLLNYLLGADYAFFGRIDTSLQFMQRVIFDYPDSLVGEEDIRNSIALWIRTNFLNNRLEPELTVVTSLMEKDLMCRPRLTYKFSDNWKLRCGADIFDGASAGTFGRYDRKNRAYSEVIYNF